MLYLRSRLVFWTVEVGRIGVSQLARLVKMKKRYTIKVGPYVKSKHVHRTLTSDIPMPHHRKLW